MRRFIPLTVAALVSGLLAPGLLAQPARAQDQPDIGAALRAHRWDVAAAGAAALPDPVARKLVDFIRMQVPGVPQMPSLFFTGRGHSGQCGRKLAAAIANPGARLTLYFPARRVKTP